MEGIVSEMKKIFATLMAALLCCSFMTSCLDPNLTETTRSSEEQEFYDKYYVNSSTVEIDFRSEPERVMSNLDHYASHPYVSDEDKAKFELAKEVYTLFPYSIKIEYSVNRNSYEEKNVTFNYFTFSYGTVGMYEECAIEVLNRICVLWLNDEIDDMYDFKDYVEAQASIAEYCDKIPTVEELREFAKNYEWLQKVDGLDYSKSAPEDERSASNYHIGDLLRDNYLKYNPKLVENTDADKLFARPNYDNVKALFVIYKTYGNAAFGREENGVLVIDNYEKMYGELDQAIMSQFGITDADFR